MLEKNTYIIVPAYNEETILRSTVLALLQTGYTIVVVDDGSKKELSLVVKDLPVNIIRHPINLGQGAALQTGNTYALQNGAKIIVHFDADGQHQPADIDLLIKPIFNNECDVTLGSRFLTNTHASVIPFGRKLILHIARYLHFFLTGILLSDAHNGLRAMNNFAANKLVLHENRMAHASEILFLLKKNKLRYKEVSVTVDYNSYSRKKGQSSWNSIRIFFDLLLHKLFE